MPDWFQICFLVHISRRWTEQTPAARNSLLLLTSATAGNHYLLRVVAPLPGDRGTPPSSATPGLSPQRCGKGGTPNPTPWEGELFCTTQRTQCRAREALGALAGYPKAQPEEGAIHQSSSSRQPQSGAGNSVWQINQLLTGEPKPTWVALRNQTAFPCHLHQHRLGIRRNLFLKRVVKHCKGLSGTW